MKLKLLTLVAFLSLVLPFSLHAQEETTLDTSDFASSYKDYVNSYDVYQKALSDYRLARAQYLQAGTLVSETKAREATVEMLRTRDTAVITYLVAVNKKVEETDGISETFRDGLMNRINVETLWFQDHFERISSAGTLTDLTDDSKEAATRFNDTQKVIYDALGTVANAKSTVLRDELNLILTATREKNFEIRGAGDLDVSSVDRWLSEIDNKLTRSLDKSIEAEATTQTLYIDKKADGLQGIYNKVLASVEESLQLLRDGSSYTKEILKVFTGES